jgi:hypothetical protein
MAHALWFLGGFVVAWTLACLMVAARRDKPWMDEQGVVDAAH